MRVVEARQLPRLLSTCCVSHRARAVSGKCFERLLIAVCHTSSETQDLLGGQAAPRKWSWAGVRHLFRGRSGWVRLPGAEDVHD